MAGTDSNPLLLGSGLIPQIDETLSSGTRAPTMIRLVEDEWLNWLVDQKKISNYFQRWFSKFCQHDENGVKVLWHMRACDSLTAICPLSRLPGRPWTTLHTRSPGRTLCTKLDGKNPTLSPLLPWKSQQTTQSGDILNVTGGLSRI